MNQWKKGDKAIIHLTQYPEKPCIIVGELSDGDFLVRIMLARNTQDICASGGILRLPTAAENDSPVWAELEGQ